MPELDDILAGEGPDITAQPEEPTEPTPDPEPEKEPEPEKAEPEEPKAEASEPEKEPEATPAPDVKQVPLTGLLAERNKRQELERELAALKQQQGQPKRDFFDNPEETLQSAIKEVESRLEEKYSSQRFRDLHAVSEQFARQSHADYDDKAALFAELVQNDDALFQQWTNSDNPAEFAYRTAYAHDQLGAVNYDLAKYRAKLEAEIRAELQAGQKPDVPASTATLPSAPQRQEAPASGPVSLDEILKSAQR